MKPLMIHVERTVRPIRATVDTKCRMREELYAHIQEIYQEELDGTGDENAAIRRACERFGDPAQLRQELQESVFWLERKFYPLIVLFNRREHESPLRYAVRAAATNAVVYVLLAVVFAVVPLIAATLRGSTFAGASAVNAIISVQIVATLGIWESVVVGLFALVSPPMVRQLEPGLLRPKSWLAVGLLSVTAVAIVCASGGGGCSCCHLQPATWSDSFRVGYCWRW